jgi:hypothetical protein
VPTPRCSPIFTKTLTDLGFESAGVSAEGLQHRWIRGEASIDVLLPDGIGERASQRLGATGSPTLPTAGGTQAPQRSETIAVMVDAGKDPYAGPIWSARSSPRRRLTPTRAILAWDRRDFVSPLGC